MRKNKNISFYHYCVEEYSDEKLVSKNYFLTMADLNAKYKKSRFTFNRVLNNPELKIRDLENLVFKRVHEPVFERVLKQFE